MRSAPTTGAQETTGSWAERPALARTVRAGVFGAPILASFLATRLLGAHYARPSGTAGFAVWLAQALVVGSAVVLLTGRAARRLLPLAALLNLSLVFPDEAPSRFRVALRSGTIRNLEAQLADVRANGFGATHAEAAERVIELVTALGRHERLTRGHTERVRAYSDLIAAEMGLPAADRDKLRWASFLHDIGKLAVPADILNKPGRPTEEEWAVLQSHPAVGGEIVEPLADWLGPWRLAASQHHERWDGKGYPCGLAGTEISLAGRIVAVADAYDVITSARSYKKPMSAAAARAELVRCSGTQFDPAVVRTFLAVSLGRTGERTGAIGWLAEVARVVANGAAQTTGAAGTAVAATAIASATAVGAVTIAPPAALAPPVEVAAEMAPQGIEPVEAARTVRVPAPANRVTPGVAGLDAGTTTTSQVPPTSTGAGMAAAPAVSTTTPAPAPPGPGAAFAPPTTAAPGAPPAAPPPAGSGSDPPPTTTTPPETTTTVGTEAPDARDDDAAVAAGGSVTIDVLANDTDADGDLDPSTLTITVAPSKGTAQVVDGVIVYTAATSPGTVNFRYRVCDTGGRCATARVQVRRD